MNADKQYIKNYYRGESFRGIEKENQNLNQKKDENHITPFFDPKINSSFCHLSIKKRPN